jgi:hypothetical protein
VGLNFRAPYPSRFFEGWEALVFPLLVHPRLMGSMRMNPCFLCEANEKRLQGQSFWWVTRALFLGFLCM